ncbi:MAG: ThiF family adenylyltransferase [Candidatus Malihini olakiniferum]
MATRHAVNAACVQQQTPLVSGSAVGFGGQLLVLTSLSPGLLCLSLPRGDRTTA